MIKFERRGPVVGRGSHKPEAPVQFGAAQQEIYEEMDNQRRGKT